MMRAATVLVLASLVVAGLSTALPARADDTPRPPKGRHLDLSLDRYAHDFGAVKQNEVRRAEFTYTNISTAPVEGISARGECGCNAVELSSTSLQPGESGTLRVEFNTLTLGGKLHKRVHLYTKDANRGHVIIDLDIAIVDGVVVRPPGLSFKEVRLGSHPTEPFYLRWYEGLGKPFEITEATVPGFEDDFRITITPDVYPKDPKWKGWKLDVTILKELPLGQFSAEVLVRTTDAERPRITMPLSANVHGKVWMQSRTLSFGVVPQGKGRSASLKFRPFDASVTFGEVTVRTRNGRIQVEVMPDPFLAKDGYWKLIGTVPEAAAPGSLEDEVIEIHTGVPGEEVTEVHVLGKVSGPR